MNKGIYLISIIFFAFISKLYTQTVSGSISGRILDEQKKPLEYASITALHLRDSSFTGSLSDEKGYFAVSVNKPGRYKVTIKFLGYETLVFSDVKVIPPNFQATLGDIILQSQAVKQDTVVISADKSLFETGIDKKVFNVEKTPLAEGGSALQILQTIPSISVDTENNIQLRGSENVMILIDGKPSALSNDGRSILLSQIPANMIERVEVITNPSAKYDPEGVAGIINIVTKKNGKELWFGSFTASIGTNSKYNANALLSAKKGKWNFGINYNFRENLFWKKGEMYRNNIFPDTSFYLSQSSHGTNWDRVHSLRLNLDYSFNPNTFLSFNTSGQTRIENEYDAISYRFFDRNYKLSHTSNRNENSINAGGINGDVGLSFRKNFQDVFHNMTADAQFSFNSSHDPTTFSQLYWDTLFHPLDTLLQENRQNIQNQVFVFQTDYVRPINKMKLETGFKTTLRKVDGELLAKIYDETSGEMLNDVRYTNHGYMQEQIYATYAQMSGKNERWGFLAGVRAEYTYLNVVQLTLDRQDKNPYFSWFPSLHLSKYLPKQQELRLSYSKRINRPGLNALNPFINFEDPFNLRYGNPKLKPEFTHSFEFSYQRPIAKLILTTSAYYRYTLDKMTRFRFVDTNGIATVTFLNLNEGHYYGAEVILKGSPYKWWTLTTSWNGYQTFINGTNIEDNLSNSGFSWNARFLSTFIPGKNVELQISYDYRAPMITILGKLKPIQGFDIAAKADFFKKKLSMSLRVSDIFDKRLFGINLYNSTITQEFIRKRETRIAFLTLTWKFGSDNSQPNMKKRRSETPSFEDNDPGL